MSEEIQEKLILCFARANDVVDNNIKTRIKKHIDALFEIENAGKEYVSNIS